MRKKNIADILIVSLCPLDRFTSSIMDCTKGRRGVTGVSVGAAGVASGRTSCDYAHMCMCVNINT